MRDRKSTRLHSSHTEISTLSLHDALPIWHLPRLSRADRPGGVTSERLQALLEEVAAGLTTPNARSEEHTSALQSHRDLHSFPTRRSSDLASSSTISSRSPRWRDVRAAPGPARGSSRGPHHPECEIGRAHVCTPVTQRSPLFPYTTLFRSGIFLDYLEPIAQVA